MTQIKSNKKKNILMIKFVFSPHKPTKHRKTLTQGDKTNDVDKN